MIPGTIIKKTGSYFNSKNRKTRYCEECYEKKRISEQTGNSPDEYYFQTIIVMGDITGRKHKCNNCQQPIESDRFRLSYLPGETTWRFKMRYPTARESVRIVVNERARRPALIKIQDPEKQQAFLTPFPTRQMACTAESQQATQMQQAVLPPFPSIRTTDHQELTVIQPAELTPYQDTWMTESKNSIEMQPPIEMSHQDARTRENQSPEEILQIMLPNPDHWMLENQNLSETLKEEDPLQIEQPPVELVPNERETPSVEGLASRQRIMLASTFDSESILETLERSLERNLQELMERSRRPWPLTETTERRDQPLDLSIKNTNTD